MFSKNKKINSWVNKVDKIVTGIIIGSAIASIFWLSQTKKWKEISNDLKTKISPTVKKTSNSIIYLFWKIIAFVVYIFSKK